MNRVGQVWEYTGGGEIFLVVSSRVFKDTGEWVHGIVFIDRTPPDVIVYPATDGLFTDRNVHNKARLA